MRKRLLYCLVIVCLFGTALRSTAVPSATEQVRETVDAVIKILKQKDLDKEKREKDLSTVIRKRFDFRTMARGALALNWRKATKEEKDRFVKLFTDLLEATYIGKIEKYNDETVTYGRERITKNRAVVETQIVTSSTEIPINYRLILEGDQWLVYDVIVEEVSLIRNFRETYREIVRREGLEGLFAKMQEKIKELKSPPEVKKEQ
jgi:phospholipid transport system substrate-binding protein